MLNLQQMIKLLILISLLLFNSSVSVGGVSDNYFKGGMEDINNSQDHEVMINMSVMKGRKLMIKLEHAMLDYQDPGANPIHDPKKGN